MLPLAFVLFAETAAAVPDVPPVPYEVPRQTLIPGTPGMPGGYHVMLNAFGELENQGLGSHRIENERAHGWNGGATYPLLQDDWIMGYGRDAGGRVEGLVMLNLEPLTVGGSGIPELGQSGEGLWDAQHAHQLFHQVMLAVHPIVEERLDLSVFGGQGSATIGPPIFMHRASSPGPTVPRKHHKGENPHETSPVIGTSLRVDSTWLEMSIFGAKELDPGDTRFTPHPAAPTSIAARVRHVIDDAVEVQISGERLRDQGGGEPDAWQGSASVYAWGEISGFRLDALVDGALDAADSTRTDDAHAASGLLLEVAARTPSRRDTLWHRTEINQREEPASRGGVVSTPWIFETLGGEHVVLHENGLVLGVFGEATYTSIPSPLGSFYGTTGAVSATIGLHLFGMWMLDGDLRPMHHHHHGGS